MPDTLVTETRSGADAPDGRAIRLVDGDVHPMIPLDVLKRQLPARWRRHYEDFGLHALTSEAFLIRPRALACRTDSWPPTGTQPGSDLAFLRSQLLDEWSIDYAVLNPTQAIQFGAQHPEYSAALCTAVNDWIGEEWLDNDRRLLAAITIPFEDAKLSVEEIERRASDKRFVHPLIMCRTRELLGHRKYWELYEAADALDLPIGVHVGGFGPNTVTGAGIPTYYLEDHLAYATSIQTHIVSLVIQGVFDRFPNLKFMLQEGGITWVPALMWAMDRSWSVLREEVPHLQRAPSEYIRERLWFTTQPIEEPNRPEQFAKVIEQLGMDDRLVFSTDYPHWDFDAPNQSIPRALGDELRERIFAGNACELYGLPL